MGELYLARLRSAGGFEKLVVIKRILSHLTDKQEFVDMFVAEARTAARISHPNVCQIYELGQVDGRYYMALEYLEGLPLADVMVARKRAPQLADLRLIASFVSQTAEGLFHAHSLRDPDGESANVVHRDVTPRNIFVTSAGVAKVLDFGIVKVRGALGQVQTGSGKGTYSYMAPEQLQTEKVDCRADIFALGTITWEAVVGRRLFKRSSDLLTWRAIVDEPIPRPTKFRPDLPPELDDAIMGALARPIEERYQSVRELASAVEQAIHPLGAPLTTLAIAAEMEKAFPTELARQRERVFSAHRRQEEPEPDDSDEESSEPTPPHEAADSVDDEWGGTANETRVAEPGYADLVARMALAKSQQLAVPSEALADVSSEGLALFDTQELKALKAHPAAIEAAVEVPIEEGQSEPIVLDTPEPILLRPSPRPAGSVALPRPSRLPSPPAPPAYVVEDRFPSGLTTLDNIAVSPSPFPIDEEDEAPPPPRRRARRRAWVPFVALALSAASGAAIVLFLNNREPSPRKSPDAVAPVAGSVVAGEPGATAAPPTAATPAAPTPTAGTPTTPTSTAGTPAEPTSTGPSTPAQNPAAPKTPDPRQAAPANPVVPADARRSATPLDAAARADLREAEETAREGARERWERARDARRERQAEKAAAEQKQRDIKRDRAEAKPAAADDGKGGGFLTINAEPYATVFVDGKKRGYTPVVRLALAPGPHRLRLVSSQGQADKKMRVRIVAGEELRKSVKW